MNTNHNTNNANIAIKPSNATVALSLAGALVVTLAILASVSNIADVQMKRVAYESSLIALPAATSTRKIATEQITVTATRLVNTNTASVGMLKKSTPPKA